MTLGPLTFSKLLVGAVATVTTVALRFMYSLVCLYYGYDASKDLSEILNLDIKTQSPLA